MHSKRTTSVAIPFTPFRTMRPRHVWFIVRSWCGGPWEIQAAARGGLDLQAYRTRKEAAADLKQVMDLYHSPPQDRVMLMKVELP